MIDICIGVSGNLSPEQHIHSAVVTISKRTPLKAQSPVYRTPAVGGRKQPDYWNTVVRVDWEGSRAALKGWLLELERKAGRKRGPDKFASRTLDLDILWWDGQPFTDEVAQEIQERPWDAWALHHVGVMAKPTVDEPATAT